MASAIAACWTDSALVASSGIPALTLGIDSAADAASLAMFQDDLVIATHVWTATGTMSRELLAAIAVLLEEASVERSTLTHIAVNIGPGQYGALRTGVATAQGIALALDAPLAGIGRFEADALPHLGRGRTVVAVHDAGRSGYAWAAYEAGPDGMPRELSAPHLDDLEALGRVASQGALWCGELNDELRDALDIEVAPPAPEPRAVSLVRIARARGAFGDPALVDAMYLRPPPITQPR
jgi:tRNA threonylcarbamoyl adenosine modification protein YeaZ